MPDRGRMPFRLARNGRIPQSVVPCEFGRAVAPPVPGRSEVLCEV